MGLWKIPLELLISCSRPFVAAGWDYFVVNLLGEGILLFVL